MNQSEIEKAADVIGDAMYTRVPGGEVQVDPAPDGQGVEIVRLIAGIPERGDGTRAMQAAAEVADRLGVRLSLTADGSYFEDQETAARWLRGFYARFGFRPDGAGSCMTRHPNQMAL
jgi:GNAT superfamily N-acetyltransferase